MHSPIRRFAPVALFAFAACYLPFDERDYQQPGYAEFRASLNLVDGFSSAPAGQKLSADLSLQPGADSKQRPRAVTSPAIVADSTLAMRNTGGYGYYSANRVWTAPPASVADTGLVVIPPAVAGLTPKQPVLRFFPWLRKGGPELFFATGDDVVLELQRPAALDSASARTVNWQLQVTRTGTSNSLQLSGTGAPPTRLRIPAENLPGDGPGDFVATMRLLQNHDAQTTTYDRRADNYYVSGTLSTTWTWKLQVRNP